MKDNNKDMTQIHAQMPEEEMEDVRELADEELKDVAGGQVVCDLRRDLGDSGIKGSVPIIRPF